MKKLVSLLVVLFIGCFCFAQNAQKTGLTDSDVQNFAKNYSKIEKELDKLGKWKADSQVTVKDITKADAILEGYGISGPDRFKKARMICLCYGLALAEEEMGGLDAETLAVLEAMGKKDPLEDLRTMTNADDYKVVQKNLKVLKKNVK